MNALDKLHAIEQVAVIYNVHYCNAGVGFCFYEPPIQFHRTVEDAEAALDPSWRRSLVTRGYYPTFEAAVDAEYERLMMGRHE